MEVDLRVLKIKESVAESERLEHYDNVIRPLTELGVIYGFTFDKELPDGNWNWADNRFEICVQFDSSRGGGFPVSVYLRPEYKKDHKRYFQAEHKFMDIKEHIIPKNNIHEILDWVIEMMVKYKNIDMTKLLKDMDTDGRYQKLDQKGWPIL